MEQKAMPYVCMGLVRFIGMGFGIISMIIVFNLLSDKWELNVNTPIDIYTDGGKRYLALAISMVASIIPMVIGQGIGSSIKIRNDNISEMTTIYWHYIANSNIIWLLSIPVGMSLLLGPENGKLFFSSVGNTFMYILIILATINGILICLVMGLSGRMIRRNNPLGYLLNHMGPLAISIFFSITPFILYELPIFPGIMIGLIIPYILIPVCGRMWVKDNLRRNPYGYL